VYLLDTNVISELRSGKPKQSQLVRKWAAAQRSNKLYLSAITILELEIGVRLFERRTPPQGQSLRKWLDGVRKEFSGRILPFAENTALICAPLHVPNKQADRDAIIAATAIEHSFTVVTRNVKDFKNLGANIVNPWVNEAI
jgi:predicted nucleic acid-binding protein